jgi:hypothetical protein
MDKPVAACTKSDEIFLGVFSEPSTGVDVVYLKTSRASAALAVPAVPLQHLLVQASVRLSVKPQSRASQKHARHGEPHV